MEQFVHQQNLLHYRKMLSEKTNEPQRQQILILLAEEEAKDQPPPTEV
jgi:hypothetical protein